LTVFCFLAIASSLSAQEFLSHSSLVEAAKNISLEKYPDSEFVQIDDYIQERYQIDGTWESWDDTAVKILTENGRREHMTMNLYYNISYDIEKFTRVEIIKSDGTVIPIDTGIQSREMINPAGMGHKIYDTNSKKLTLSIPGLEVGDILRYVIHSVGSKPRVPNTWSAMIPFERSFPIERMTYEVIAPQSLPLEKKNLKNPISGTVMMEEYVQGDSIVYTWKIQNVSRMLKEPKMPPLSTVAQHLLVSSIKKWQDLSIWYWNLCEPRLLATTPEMLAKAIRLTRNCKTTREKIESIFHFVSQEIRYTGIITETEAPGYEPHDVYITFEKRYGVCRDKAALLAAMLRLVDIEAFPAIVQTNHKLDNDVPIPWFNHAVTVALDDDGSYVLMDSTDETTKDIFPAYLQDKSFLVARPGGETLKTSPLVSVENNLLSISTEGSLSLEGTLTAESRLVFEGINDNWFRVYFLSKKPKERHRFIEGRVKRSIPTAILDQVTIYPENLNDTAQPLIIKIKYTAEDMFVGDSTKKMLNIPKIGSSFSFVNKLLGHTELKKRKYPFYIGTIAGIRETLLLTLPTSIDRQNIPESKEIDSPMLTWGHNFSISGNQLKSTSTLLLKTLELSPEKYLQFKEYLKVIEYNNRKKIILENVHTADPTSFDIYMLSRERTIRLINTSAWVETIKKRFKILTYAGKKAYSEIKLGYNPAWQTVQLASAQVTAPDGTIKTIAKEEIKIMDAKWVASAPRYPEGKILIVSFPAVEVGSIIEYEIVSTVYGKPFFSHKSRFNDFDPVKHQTFTLTSPIDLPVKIRNMGVVQTKTTNGETITYKWTSDNPSTIKKEKNMPRWWIYNPSLIFSTGTWQNYANLINTKLLDATNNQLAVEVLGRSLTKGIIEEKEKVYAIRNWIAKNIREAGPLLPQMPLSAITPAGTTLLDRYGNETDRAVVLYTMLKAAGIKAIFVLVGDQSLNKEAYQPLLDTPQRRVLDHVLVKLEIDGEQLFLDCSSQYAELGTSPYEDQPLLNLDLGEIQFLSVRSNKLSRTDIIYDITLLENGDAEIRETIEKNGTGFGRFKEKFSRILPENRRRTHLKMVAAVSRSARAISPLITDFSTYPGRQEFLVKATQYGVLDKDYLYFTLPTNRLTTLLKYRADKRISTLAWNWPVRAVIEYNITIPDGYQVEIAPREYSWIAPHQAGVISVSVRYDKSNNSIHIIHKADLKPALLPASIYPEVLEVGRQMSHPKTYTILLKVKKPDRNK